MGAQRTRLIPERILNYLRIERALPDWAIRHFGLGWRPDLEAIEIPIEGLTKYRSLRGYDSVTGDVAGAKMWWRELTERERSEPRPPYPSWGDLRDSDLIVEGEFDAMVAIVNGFLAISGTLGAATWTQEWADALSGQSRVILYDHDAAGVKGALAAAETLDHAGCLVSIASWPADKPMGYDVTEHFRSGGSRDELVAVIAAAIPYERPMPGRRLVVRA